MPVLLFPAAFHIFEMVNAQFHELILFPDEQQVLLSCISQGIRHFKKKKSQIKHVELPAVSAPCD